MRCPIRGFMFSYEAVRDWEAKLTPTLAEELRRSRRGKVRRSWYLDETYIRVNGDWKYLYRAIGMLRDNNVRTRRLRSTRLSPRAGSTADRAA